MKTDKLVPIPYSEWPKLPDLYKKDPSKYCIVYQTIKNYIRWYETYPIEIFSLNNDWSDGSFILFDKRHILTHTCNDDYNNISKLLLLVDWSKEWDLFAYRSSTRDAIHKVFEQCQLQTGRHTETIMYYLPKEEALKFVINTPEGFTLKQLTEENADTVNSLWPYHKDGTLIYLKRLIRYNPSIGIFNEENQELAGWVLRSQIGTLSMLQVQSKYSRRGFGSLLVKALGKVIAEEGDDICATIVTTNLPSINLFQKLGFKPVDKIYWTEDITKNVNESPKEFVYNCK